MLEDVSAINRRKRAYNRELLIEKLPLPGPAKALVVAGQSPKPQGLRARPSGFTFTQEYHDGGGNIWTYAPYTCEAWEGRFPRSPISGLPKSQIEDSLA